MKRSRSIFVAVLALAGFAAGQSLQMIPDVGVAEAEYRDAVDAWMHSDTTLEADLLKRPAEEMRTRIRNAAALRDNVMVKKEAYFRVIIARLRDTRSRLGQADAGAIPAQALKKDLEAQQSRVLGEQESVEALLRDVPEGDENLLVRRALADERANLVALQNNIALRLRSLEQIDQAQQSLANAAKPDALVGKLDEVLKIWDGELEAVRRQRSIWAKLYSSMEAALGPAGFTPNAATASATPVAAQQNAPNAAVRGGASRNDAGGMEGTWTYHGQAGSWAGFGEPQTVTLVLRGRGDELAGTYDASLPLDHGIATVRLALTCVRRFASSARLHWTSQMPPGEGELEIKLSSDGRLLLERLRADDSYFPPGMEVLEKR